MVDLRQSGEYAKWMETMGWRAVPLGNKKDQTVFAYLKKIPLLGSVMKILRPTGSLPLEKIKEVARIERSIFVKIEPDIVEENKKLLNDLSKHGYSEDRWSLICTKTLRVDLKPSEKTIFEQFKKDCRYEIRKAEKMNLRIEFGNFDCFYNLIKRTNKIKGLWTFPLDQFKDLVACFKKDVFVLNCFDNRGELVAGCLVLISDRAAYYFLAGSLPRGKELYAQYLVVWEGMKKAKKAGCHTWDFEGLEDERIPSTKKWIGFSHFKRSFGGSEVEFPGSFTWYRNRFFRIFSPFS